MKLIKRYKYTLKNVWNFALAYVRLSMQPLGFSATYQNINNWTSWSLFVFDSVEYYALIFSLLILALNIYCPHLLSSCMMFLSL